MRVGIRMEVWKATCDENQRKRALEVADYEFEALQRQHEEKVRWHKFQAQQEWLVGETNRILRGTNPADVRRIHPRFEKKTPKIMRT